jgi:hypothetical protein
MEAGEYIPLARAAALVYGRLFPQERVKAAKTLDVLAVAISAHVPICQQETEKSPVRVLEQAEIALGRFTRGAARLELPGRPPLRFLLVPRAALHAAMETIAQEPILRTCRRPPPACSSATAA